MNAHASRTQVIAFYLPQFHPIPENDAAWGEGFTEWTHVARARPLFRRHYQPHIPADLGFYDLRLPEIREAQAALARTYGISAFCYYHYWFAGSRMLERPFNEVLNTGSPDFPFCLCWANDSWTGVWYGRAGDIIKEQTYPGIDDHLAHFDALARAFHDPRYLRIDGKPLLLIFKPQEIPNVSGLIDLWRRRAGECGLPGIHLVAVRFYKQLWNPHDAGFDASVTFRLPLIPNGFDRSVVRETPWVLDHRQVVDRLIEPAVDGTLDYPCTGPNWDNTPRSGTQGIVLHGSTPALFERSLRQAAERVARLPPSQRLCFLKAWNEWAEGNHLEPDRRFGRGWLEAVRRVFPPPARIGTSS